MNLFSTLGCLPTSLLLLIFQPSILHVIAQQQPQQPLYTISSFDSSSNFALDTACDSIYRRSIQSCQPFDFVPTNPCSSLCIQSLQSIQAEAQNACSSQGGIPSDSLLAAFRNGTGVNRLCASNKVGTVATTLSPQASPISGGRGSPTVPPGAGGVSTATEVPADDSESSGMDLGSTGITAIIVVIVVVSILLSLASIFYYNKYYNRKTPP